MSTDSLGGATAGQSSAITEIFTPSADQSIPDDPTSGGEVVCGGGGPDALPVQGEIVAEDAADAAIEANEDAAQCADGLALVLDGGGTCEAPAEDTAAEEASAQEAAPAEEAPAEEAASQERVQEELVKAQFQEKIKEAIKDNVEEEKTSTAKSTKKADAARKDAERAPEGFTRVGTLNVGDKFAGLNSSPTKSAARGDIRPEASMSLVVPKIAETNTEAAKTVSEPVVSKTSPEVEGMRESASRVSYGESIPIRKFRPIAESPMDPNFGPDVMPGARTYNSAPHTPLSERFESNESPRMGSIAGISSRTFLFNVYDVHNTLDGQPSVLQVLDKNGRVVREITLTAGAHSQHEIELAEGEYTVVAKSGQVAAASDGKKDQYDNFRVDVLEKQSASKSEGQAVEAASGSPSADNGSASA